MVSVSANSSRGSFNSSCAGIEKKGFLWNTKEGIYRKSRFMQNAALWHLGMLKISAKYVRTNECNENSRKSLGFFLKKKTWMFEAKCSKVLAIQFRISNKHFRGKERFHTILKYLSDILAHILLASIRTDVFSLFFSHIKL